MFLAAVLEATGYGTISSNEAIDAKETKKIQYNLKSFLSIFRLEDVESAFFN